MLRHDLTGPRIRARLDIDRPQAVLSTSLRRRGSASAASRRRSRCHQGFQIVRARKCPRPAGLRAAPLRRSRCPASAEDAPRMLAKLSTVEYSTRIRAARSARAHIIAIEPPLSSHDETCPLNLTEVRRFYDRWMTLGKRPGLIAASCRCRRTGTARSESAYPWPAHRADCHDGGRVSCAR